ncbi:exo-1,3-beta-glucanase [Saitozyma podzolica]|uniref:Exo-1,3-beta-glucanase n=1 Tax=Saitozyma podzolica TaxID=1890683 RepID=A0A427YCB8_9TREE|nr:exo-1,3-beta-glucanase [Saitozyma podzolica]
MLASSLVALASLLAPLAALRVNATPLAERGVNVGWPYGSEKIRGVNIGGWLVIEPFITPSLFQNTGNDAIVDEWTFGQYQDYNTAQNALVNHWNSWITEDDFAQIAAAGLNHVRIPIGYWAYDISAGEPYHQGQAQYLDNAIGWARNHGLKVLIDLHGAPGSQNGYDNSGHRGSATWDQDPNNVLRTKNIIQSLSLKYSDPSYWQVGSASKSGLAIAIHDAFQSLSYWNNYMTEPTFEDVFLDTHNYQVFNQDYQTWTQAQHISGICSQAGNYASSPLWLVVGEWSLASSDCAQWVNGRGLGARMDGSYPGSYYVNSCNGLSGSSSTWSSDYKTFLRKFYDAQTQVYENNGQGWIMWTWKTETSEDWSYQAGLAGGWIPSDPTNHQYSVQTLCG